MVVGVLGERGPWEVAEGELGREFASSSAGGTERGTPAGMGIAVRERKKNKLN